MMASPGGELWNLTLKTDLFNGLLNNNRLNVGGCLKITMILIIF